MTSTSIQTALSTWSLDPAHSDVEFAVRHMMISSVKGQFGQVAGSVTIDETEPANLSVEATIQVSSITTRQEQRDAHLRSPDFFNADEYPVITFKSTGVNGDPASGEFRLSGNLTIRDVTKPVTLDVEVSGRAMDIWGGERIGFNARTKIDRREFGLTYNQALETGGVLVGDEIKISIDGQLVRTSES